MMIKQTTLMTLAILLTTTGTVLAEQHDKVAQQGKKITAATEVYNELLATPDRSVPKELLENCKCIAVLPSVVKVAVGIGARHGSGVMTCRTPTGWSAPAFVNLSGGNFGLQLGANSTDLVLFFMTDKGARSLVKGTKITLGGNASVAAGPWGRSGEADTNLELKSEIYSYARSKGLFAGLSFEGARLAPNPKDITDYYGPGVTAEQLLFGGSPASKRSESLAFGVTFP